MGKEFRKIADAVLVVLIASYITTVTITIVDIARAEVKITQCENDIQDFKLEIREDLNIIKEDIKKILGRI